MIITVLSNHDQKTRTIMFDMPNNQGHKLINPYLNYLSFSLNMHKLNQTKAVLSVCDVIYIKYWTFGITICAYSA